MQLTYRPTEITERFDDTQIITDSGLIPIAQMLEHADLAAVTDTLLTRDQTADVDGRRARPGHKLATTVLGMCAGADTVSDLDMLQAGATPRVFTDIRARSTIGAFHRALTEDNIAEYAQIAAHLTRSLARQARLLAAPDRSGLFGTELVMVDVDDTIVPVHSTRKEGAALGYTRTVGLSALLAMVSTWQDRPIIVGQDLRPGNLGGSACSGQFLTSALDVVRQSWDPTGALCARVLTRADSAFYSCAVVHAAIAHGGYVSVGIKQFPNVKKAIAGIDEDAWIPIIYPGAILGADGVVIESPAQVAEVEFIAFSSNSKKASDRVVGRLVTRRVPSKRAAKYAEKFPDQEQLYPLYEYHSFFTTLPADEYPTVAADMIHRGHAIVEQVNADLKAGALAHLPFVKLTANTAWLHACAMSYNLVHAAAALTPTLRSSRTSSIRRKLINVPARIARSGRKITVHMPANWPWAADRLALTAALRSPPVAA